MFLGDDNRVWYAECTGRGGWLWEDPRKEQVKGSDLLISLL